MSFFFFFNDTATTEIYTLSLHDALPISQRKRRGSVTATPALTQRRCDIRPENGIPLSRKRSNTTRATFRSISQRRCVSARSEEHTSELQSQSNLVCRLLLEKKK